MNTQSLLISAILICICILSGAWLKINLLQKENDLLLHKNISLNHSLSDALDKIQQQNEAINKLKVDYTQAQEQAKQAKQNYATKLEEALSKQGLKLDSIQTEKEELQALYTLLRVSHASN